MICLLSWQPCFDASYLRLGAANGGRKSWLTISGYQSCAPCAGPSSAVGTAFMRQLIMHAWSHLALAAAALLAAPRRHFHRLMWLLLAAIASTVPAAVAETPLKASDFKMAGNAVEMRVVLGF